MSEETADACSPEPLPATMRMDGLPRVHACMLGHGQLGAHAACRCRIHAHVHVWHVQNIWSLHWPGLVVRPNKKLQ